MKKSELIKALQEIEGDFDVKLKTPSEYELSLGKVTSYEPDQTITLYSE